MSPGIELVLRLQRAGFALDVDLHLPGRGVTALFGPSGSGKTTLLRAVAGLEPRAAGRVRIGESIWQDDAPRRFLPPPHRAVGYVPQDSSLFPHLSVRANLEYGWRRRGRPAWDQSLVDLLGLEPLLARRPRTLSGGERQRVAIARALLTAPRLLLLDEPLASLDTARKAEVLPYLERLHARLEIPLIYVSHAVEEVSRLADHLVLLEAGRVRASGAAAALMTRLDLAGAFADEAGALIEAVVAEHDATDHLTRLRFEGGELWVPLRSETLGTRLRARIQARDVSLTTAAPAHSSILNLLPARVVEMAPAPAPGQILVRLEVGTTALMARITERSQRLLQLAPGSEVWAQVKTAALLGWNGSGADWVGRADTG